MKYTVFGHTGFIGGEVVKALSKSKGYVINTPERDYKPGKKQNLGNVIYCIGLTADFRKYPIKAVDAHVCKLKEILENSEFESFVYLSSARVYQKSLNGRTDEDADIVSNPNDFGDLYNISKIMGESVCLSYKQPKIKVARPTNVIGCDFTSDNFMTQVIKEVIENKTLTLQTHLSSNKDFVYIDDVVNLLINLHKGNFAIYNLGSGRNMETIEIVNELKKHLNFKLIADDHLPIYEFPKINIKKIKDEFNYQPSNILSNLDKIIKSYSNENNN